MRLYGLTLEKLGFWGSKNEKLLGLAIDRNLYFDDHVFTLCKEAGRKLAALSKISNYINFEKK